MRSIKRPCGLPACSRRRCRGSAAASATRGRPPRPILAQGPYDEADGLSLQLAAALPPLDRTARPAAAAAAGNRGVRSPLRELDVQIDRSIIQSTGEPDNLPDARHQPGSPALPAAER